MKVFSDVVVYFNETKGWGGFCDLMKVDGGIAQCYTIPTKTTENIIVTGAENGYRFYYIEDENDVFVYGDFANAGTPTWSSMGALFGITFGGIINSMSEATDTTRYYAFFANSYQFKNELTFDGVDFGGDAGIVEIPLKFVSNDVDYTRIAIAKTLLSGNYYTWVGYFVDDDAPNGDEVNDYYYYNEDFGTAKKGWQNETYKTIIAKEEITNTWLLANIEEVKEETPLAEITYNGETIAQLNAGETAILKCDGLPMETDIIVKVNG